MQEKRNSASRVRDILISAKKYPDNIRTISVWLETFKINAEENRRNGFIEATRKIELLYQELECIREHMRKGNFRPSTYEPALEKIETAISPEIFVAGWASGKQHLTNDVIVALDFCLDLLPDEEGEISLDDIESISRDIDDLEKSLEASGLSFQLKKTIQRYIHAIRAALQDYSVSGAKALKKASQTAVGEIIEVKAEIIESQNDPAVRKFGSVWKKVNTVADTVSKADKLGQIGLKALDFLSQWLN